MTDLTPSLTGEHVRLVPYGRGYYGRDYLYRLWQMVEYAGNAADIFYAQACARDTERGDLVEFVTYFSHPTRQLLVITRASTGAPFGLVWFDQMAGQRHGLIGLWYQRYTTTLAREGTALATRYAFAVLGYPKLVGWTPHKTALQHGLALGWRHEATLSGLVEVAGTPADIYVLVLEPAHAPPSTPGAGGPDGHPVGERAAAEDETEVP